MQTAVLSLGGSIIVPDAVDTAFLKKFKALIEAEIKAGKRFVIVCGGGETNKRYLTALHSITDVRDADADWLGIMATRLNAELVRILFGKLAHSKVLVDPTAKSTAKEPIIIAAGWKPGHSTDYDAVLWAKQFDADTIVNLSNVAYVYTADPKKDPKAKKIEQTTWKEFRKLIGNAWSPRLSMPFDPIASKEAEKLGITVIIAKGTDLKNTERILKGAQFEGTVIKR